jgi:hypothetical protein
MFLFKVSVFLDRNGVDMGASDIGCQNNAGGGSVYARRMGMSWEGRIKFYCPCKCAARSMPEAGGALNIYLQIIG